MQYGWGTWIRTRVARSRAGSSTAKLSPNAFMNYHIPYFLRREKMKPMDGLHTVYHSLLGKNINLKKEIFLFRLPFLKDYIFIKRFLIPIVI